MTKDYRFSAIICVYYKDNPIFFEKALYSIINQTMVPNEINIICDGNLTIELDNIILKYEKQYSFINVYRLKENCGHGNARRYAIEKAKYPLIALMDADDISEKNRFEKQINIFKKYNNINIVGGEINEFIDNVQNVVGIRKVPEHDAEIKKFMKRRCPMNQVTVMFEKDAVIKSGNYIDWYCEEDYYLWIRMAEKGYNFYNIQENLVNVRVGKQMYERRGGIKYYRSEKRVQKYMLDHKLIGYFRYKYNTIIRFIAEVMIPNRLRGFLYKILLRKR